MGFFANIFSNNRDFDSTALVILYGATVLSHVFLGAFVDGYADGGISTEMNKWVENIGLVLFGAMFRRGGENNATPTTEKG